MTSVRLGRRPFATSLLTHAIDRFQHAAEHLRINREHRNLKMEESICERKSELKWNEYTGPTGGINWVTIPLLFVTLQLPGLLNLYISGSPVWKRLSGKRNLFCRRNPAFNSNLVLKWTKPSFMLANRPISPKLVALDLLNIPAMFETSCNNNMVH